jgi:predicted Zn-dependent peptidase
MPWFCLLLLVFPAILSAQAPPFLDAVTRYRLPNGLTVVLAPDSQAVHTSVELWVPAGSRHDPVGQRGTAHLLEHISAALSASIDTAGLRRSGPRFANSNAQVRRDHARYFLLVDPSALDAALAIHAARLALDPIAITDTVVRANADIVVNEGRTGTAEPTTAGIQPFWRLQQGAYGIDHPYGLVGETEGSVRSITATDLQRFTRARASVRDAILLVVGDFDREGARSLIAARFGGLPPGVGVEVRATRLLPVRRAWRREQQVALSGPSRLTRRFVVPPLGEPALEHAELALRAVLVEWRRLAGDALKTPPRLALEPGQLASDLTVDAELVDGPAVTRASSMLEMAIANIARAGGAAVTTALPEARAEARAALLSLLDGLGFQRSRTEQLGEGTFFADDPLLAGRRLDRFTTTSAAEVSAAAGAWLLGAGYELGLAAEQVSAPVTASRPDAPIALDATRSRRLAISLDTIVAGVRLLVTPKHSLPLVRATVVTAPDDTLRPADATRQRARGDVESLWAWLADMRRSRARTTIYLTGALDQALAIRAMTAAVRNWPAGRAPTPPERIALTPGVRVESVPAQGDVRAQARLRIEWRVPTRDAAEELAARIARRQLATLLNSRLRGELRWSYGANGSAVTEGDSTRFAVTADVQPDKAREALVEVEQVVRRFGEGRTRTPALAALAETMRQELLLDYSTLAGVESALRADVGAGRRAGWSALLLARVEQLAEADLAAARALARWERAAVSLTGPLPPS